MGIPSATGRVWLIAAMAAGCSASPPPAPCVSPLVLAASDLQYAFAALGERYAAAHGCAPTFSFGSTGAFTTQLEGGAHADAFFAANASYVDRLDAAGLVVAGTRTPYAVGRLVVAAAPTYDGPIGALADLRDPRVKFVAIANPEHAPYGVAAKEALTRAGVWDELQPRIVTGDNIARTMQLVQSGNADVGLVALSVALGTPGARYAPVDPASHTPLVQVAAVPTAADHPDEGRSFVSFVVGEGRPVLAEFGFEPPVER